MQPETAFGEEDHLILPRGKKRRVRKAPAPLEDGVQMAIKGRLIFHGIACVHIKNEGKRSMFGHIAAKKAGMIAGIPDLILLRRPGVVGFLECKRPGWTPPSDDAKGEKAEHWRRQRDTHEWLRGLGFNVSVVTSQDDALAAVRAWGWVR